MRTVAGARRATKLFSGPARRAAEMAHDYLARLLQTDSRKNRSRGNHVERLQLQLPGRFHGPGNRARVRNGQGSRSKVTDSILDRVRNATSRASRREIQDDGGDAWTR